MIGNKDNDDKGRAIVIAPTKLVAKSRVDIFKSNTYTLFYCTHKRNYTTQQKFQNVQLDGLIANKQYLPGNFKIYYSKSIIISKKYNHRDRISRCFSPLYLYLEKFEKLVPKCYKS